MDITLPGTSITLIGSQPIVVLGANGSGKTRLAVDLSRQLNAEFIPAIRNLSIPDQLPNWTLQTATSELLNRTNNRKNQYWELISEMDALFAKLLSAHASQAMSVYEHIRKDGTVPPITDTVLDTTSNLWEAIFPGREIKFKDFSPIVKSEYLSGVSYTAKQMSDGERTGLYLAARVFDSSQTVIIVDEPETHFHSRLAVRFWDALESICTEKQFIYVTHDLSFALSRNDARFVIARAGESPQVLDSLARLPADDVKAILGAASFSVYAQRVMFCEGSEGKSLDQELLRAWFHDRGTALVPVGGCDNVKRCTAAFATSGVVTGLSAIGIIDRDHWPDDELNAGGVGLHVLSVHEIESLYSIPGVYLALAAHLGTQESNARARYQEALDKFVENAPGTLTNKLIAERFKARASSLFDRAFTEKPDYSDRAAVLLAITNDLTRATAVFDTTTLWDEEVAIVEAAAKSGDPIQILRIFPGKPILPEMAKSLGITKERYCDLVKQGLNAKVSSDSSKEKLCKDLEEALKGYFPPRIHESGIIKP